jgi:hypothetical protein
VAVGSVPLVERLRAKSLDGGDQAALLLTTNYADLGQMDSEFWQAFEGLDRDTLVQRTLQTLADQGQPMTLAELAAALPPGEHDLETFALWLAMAREAGVDLPPGEEQVETQDGDQHWCFTVPRVALDGAQLAQKEWEL